MKIDPFFGVGFWKKKEPPPKKKAKKQKTSKLGHAEPRLIHSDEIGPWESNKDKY